MSETIKDVNILKQSTEDMQKYAIYVSRYRAMPEYRDGLKPVHRKIMWALYHDEKATDRFVKSAAVVGTVIKKYHPHGDTAAYGSMKPLSNWFEIYIPLIDHEGNFGNFQGDGAAAQRYTEVKMSNFATDCVIGELKESNQVVDWTDTYDYRDKEPEYLPAKVPLLLINGAFGIAVGVKIEIPRHNVNEVIDATLKLIDNPDAKIVLIPDTCMPCEIIEDNFKAISNTGSGSFKVRGIIETTEWNHRPALAIKSVPDLVFLNNITEKIEKLMMENKIIQIADTHEKHTDDQMNLIIELKKGSDPEYVKQVIYKHTEMEKTCRVNMEILDGITPMRMSYKSYLLAFIEFRKLTKFRLYSNRLQLVQTTFHQIDAYVKVLQSGEIDNIIDMIKGMKTNDDTKIIEYLIRKIGLTDLQAKFIITRNLRSLSIASLNQYLEDRKNLLTKIEEYKRKILDDSVILQEIKDELLEYKRKYGGPRRSKVISKSEASNIPEGEFKIVVTENNFIKKLQVKDPINLKNDTAKCVLKVNNTENILIFDELGKVFKLPVHKIAFTDRNSAGIDIRMIIKGLTSNINSILYEPLVTDFAKRQSKYFIVVLTKNGMIKKMDLDDILTAPASGIIYVKLEPGDVVQDIMVINHKSDVIVYSENRALRMSCDDISHLKRATKGAKAMPADKVDGLSLITHDTTDIIIITEKGYINRFSPAALPCLGRNKTASKVIKLTKGDKIKSIYGLNMNDSIRIISHSGSIDIAVKDLIEGSSISSGIKVLNTRGDSIIKTMVIRKKD